MWRQIRCEREKNARGRMVHSTHIWRCGDRKGKEVNRADNER